MIRLIKSNILITLSSLFFLIISAQAYSNETRKPASATINFLQDTSLKAIEGEWQWISGADTLSIFIKQVDKPVSPEIPAEAYKRAFIGWHRFVQKRNFMEGSYSFIADDTLSKKYSHATVFGHWKKDGEYAISLFIDLTGDLQREGYIELLKDKTTGILVLRPKKDIRFVSRNRDFPYQFTTIPGDIVLRKVLPTVL